MMYVDRAVILAAGLGTRLKWLTRDRPKALMPIGQVPAIEHVIRWLSAQGIRDIAINLHHQAEAISDVLKCGDRLGVRLVYSREEKLLDSGGGVRQALGVLPGEGPVAVHNADVLADVPLQSLAVRLPRGGASVALVENPAHHSQGDFGLQGEKVVAIANGNSYTFAGVSVFDPAVIAGWPEMAFPLSRVLQKLMGVGKLTGLKHKGMWIDIGRPHDFFAASHLLSSLPE